MPSVMRFEKNCLRRSRTIAMAFGVLALMASGESQAATTWDSQVVTANNNPAGDGTQWWFDPYNWSGTGNNPGDPAPHFLPPSVDGAGSASTDTQINVGTTTLPGGEGVVYDPSSNDPNFATAGSYNYPTGGYGPQVIGALYISRNTSNTNVLTIKGDLQVGLGANTSAFQVGRSGSSVGSQNLGEIVQTTGKVTAPTTNLDIGQWEASGWGNGTYDYRGGTLDVYNDLTGHGIRISHGSATNGTGGVGKLIMHNPASGGYLRTYTLSVASERTNGDGITRGVGILEFDYENGNTRPIQVLSNLSINNGLDNTPQGAFPASTRSSRLDLVLHAAPTVVAGVPQNLGLIDVNFRNLVGGVINGTGDLDGDALFNDDRVFSNANAPDPLAVSAAYYQDSIVSATFGSTKYNWKISYTGSISWTDDNNSVVGSVAGTGGTDVVLIGFSTESVGLPGDFNSDGKVDAGDYVTWRKNNLTNNALANDNGLGIPIGPNHYTLWRQNFGKPPGAGADAGLGASSVPEPNSCWLALCLVIGGVLAHRQR